MYIQNLHKEVQISGNKVRWGWFRVPVDDLSFYFTPRTLNRVKACGNLIKIEEVSWELTEFRSQFEEQLVTATGTKIDATPLENHTSIVTQMRVISCHNVMLSLCKRKSRPTSACRKTVPIVCSKNSSHPQHQMTKAV